MGKSRQSKAQRQSGKRPPSEKERHRRIVKNDRRGRSVQSTISGYEAVCAQGPTRLAETLIARHTSRMDRIRLTSPYLQLPILSSLAPISALDGVLLHHGANPRRPPPAYIGGWSDHLLWGVDSAVSTARLLLCGQVVGAAAVARNQLERWTLHRAHNAGLSQQPGETTIDYVARVWSAKDSFHAHWFDESDGQLDDEEEPDPPTPPTIDHTHVETTDGTEICPALIYAYLSEIMHGRALPEALAWDASGMLRNDPWPEDMLVAAGVISDAITLSLRQIRVAAAALAVQRGDVSGVAMLKHSLDYFSEPGLLPSPEERRSQREAIRNHFKSDDPSRGVSDSEPEGGNAPTEHPEKPTENHRRSPSAVMFSGLAVPALQTMIPLVPNEGLSSDVVKDVRSQSRVFEATMLGDRPAGRLFRDDELLRYSFAWHRARSINTALAALNKERADLGDDFEIESLTSRSTRWTVLAESASLVGQWHDRPESAAAAALIGSGLRSAYWLWLEDDDRAMSVLRCVFEQAARLRTWRTKPARAATLESRAQTRPRDWIDAAGWKRLSALNKALGEFAHTKTSSKWTGARDLLTKLQQDVDPEMAMFTARGAALDFVSDLVATEILAEIAPMSDKIETVLRDLFKRYGFDPDQTRPVEEAFNHMWSLRASELGSSDFTPVEGTHGADLFVPATPPAAMSRRGESARDRGPSREPIGVAKVNPFVRPKPGSRHEQPR